MIQSGAEVKEFGTWPPGYLPEWWAKVNGTFVITREARGTNGYRRSGLYGCLIGGEFVAMPSELLSWCHMADLIDDEHDRVHVMFGYRFEQLERDQTTAMILMQVIPIEPDGRCAG